MGPARRWTLIASLVVLGWGAQAAYGAGTMSVQGGRILYQASPGEADNVTESTTAPLGFGTFFYPGGPTQIAAGPGPGCQATTFDGHPGVACPALPVEFRMLDGSDTLLVTRSDTTVDMGSGDDLVTLYDGAGVADVHGGDGVDTVASGPTVCSRRATPTAATARPQSSRSAARPPWPAARRPDTTGTAGT